MKTPRRLAAVLAASAALVALSGGTAHAENPTPSELFNCAFDVGGCNIAANDAAPWALGVAQSRYPAETLRRGPGDAFRHCIWAGAITQRIGKDRARSILNAHEAEAPPGSESAMDYGNNSIGMTVGSHANAEGGSDTWGWIINYCYDLEQADRLYLVGYDPSTWA